MNQKEMFERARKARESADAERLAKSFPGSKQVSRTILWPKEMFNMQPGETIGQAVLRREGTANRDLLKQNMGIDYNMDFFRKSRNLLEQVQNEGGLKKAIQANPSGFSQMYDEMFTNVSKEGRLAQLGQQYRLEKAAGSFASPPELLRNIFQKELSPYTEQISQAKGNLGMVNFGEGTKLLPKSKSPSNMISSNKAIRNQPMAFAETGASFALSDTIGVAQNNSNAAFMETGQMQPMKVGNKFALSDTIGVSDNSKGALMRTGSVKNKSWNAFMETQVMPDPVFEKPNWPSVNSSVSTDIPQEGLFGRGSKMHADSLSNKLPSAAKVKNIDKLTSIKNKNRLPLNEVMKEASTPNKQYWAPRDRLERSIYNFFDPETRASSVRDAGNGLLKANKFIRGLGKKGGALGAIANVATIPLEMATFIPGKIMASDTVYNSIHSMASRNRIPNTTLVRNAISQVGKEGKMAARMGMGAARMAGHATKYLTGTTSGRIMLGAGALIAGVAGSATDDIDNTAPIGSTAGLMQNIGGPVGLAGMAYLSSRDRTNDLQGADLAATMGQPNKPDGPMSFGGGGSVMGGGKDYSMGASGNLALALSNLRRGG